MATNFDTLLVAVQGTAWPKLTSDQAAFLESCPKNKQGWHHYQITGGPVVHYKTGLDFRNPSVPFQIVKVAGLRVYVKIGGYGGGYDTVNFGLEGNRIWAVKQDSVMWMPFTWEPEVDALAFYRRYFGEYAFSTEPITDDERRILWAISVPLPGNGTCGEAYYRGVINYWRGRIKTISFRGAIMDPADGKFHAPELEAAMSNLQSAVANYIIFVRLTKDKIEAIL